MLRPERMSKVSVTGSKRVMDQVIEATHDLHLLHLTDYDGSWEGFGAGDPVTGAEDASDKLVTVRALESILDVDEDDAGPTRIVTDEALEEELEEVRTRVNELDDRRDEIRDELREVEDELDAVRPFVQLGIDLDLLSDYRTIDASVGRGNAAEIEAALREAEGIEAFETYSQGNVVAVFARPADGGDEDALTDALVGTEFAAIEVPDAEGSPEEYARELEHRKQQLESRLENVEGELEEVKLDAAGFLLAAEEQLSIEVQKTEAPLSFATTQNSFVAEGWIPTEEYGEFERALTEAVGDHVEVEEVERAEFKTAGHGEVVRERPTDESAAATDGGTAKNSRDATDGGREARSASEAKAEAEADANADAGEPRADGGTATMKTDDPPVIQDNPDPAKPFELLVEAVSRPKYREFDPTIVLWLTFPAFFGFMIGDVGYGILYVLIGYFLYSNFDSDAIRSMGGITLWAGGFTILFGFLYGELFGLHFFTENFWQPVVGMEHAPMEKGLSPAGIHWAQTWLVVSVLVGILHLNVGYAFDFVENLQFHDVKHAVYESASWLLLLNGIWIYVFSTLHGGANGEGLKPAFLYTIFDGEPFALGFAGFPEPVGYLGGLLFAAGFVLLAIGEPVELAEVLSPLVNVLSYTRIAAVLLAKGGMALTVNLLAFGAYEHNGEFHFMTTYGPQYVAEHYPEASVMFPGLFHSGPAAVLVGLLVLVIGHLLVLALGITSAGLQAVRLEYVEFFGKFYDGGGRAYDPFGYDRTYTTRD